MTARPMLLLLDALTVYRLTRLVTVDAITAGLRQRLIGTAYSPERDAGGYRMPLAARPRLAEFITCPWCTSPYLATGVVAMQSLLPTVTLYATAVLASSAVAGILSERV